MKIKVCLLVILIFLFVGIKTTESQMDPKTLIQLMNYSNSLIQDGEIKYLLYRQFPEHPDELGREHQKLLANWEKQLVENPPKSKDPEALRKQLLGHLEREKRFGKFRDSKERFIFMEGNLVFQNENVYRLEAISRFENFPSLDSHRFFNGGGLFFFVSNGKNRLKGRYPEQFANDNRIGYFEWEDGVIFPDVIMGIDLPASPPINESHAEVQFTETDNGDPTYIVTHFPYDKVKKKIYVKLKSRLPEVYREEFFYLSDSPHADAEGYWLRKVNMYRDFESVEELNITVPKVRELQEFRGKDMFMRHHGIMVILEMDFNLGLPDHFFDWDEKDITLDSGKRKRIRGMDSK